jgi:hypothetical protein
MCVWQAIQRRLIDDDARLPGRSEAVCVGDHHSLAERQDETDDWGQPGG